MDENYPLFNNKRSIEKNVEFALKKSKLNLSSSDIKQLFEISDVYFKLSLGKTGNERLRCMSAIGYAYGKNVFCFPWISKKHMEYYARNIFRLLDILSDQHKFIILPTNYTGMSIAGEKK